MKDKDKDKFSIEEETEWRIQVLKRTARISAAKAKQRERIPASGQKRYAEGCDALGEVLPTLSPQAQ